MTLENSDTEAIQRYLAYRAEQSRQRRRYVAPVDLLVGLRAATHNEQHTAVLPTNAGILKFGFDPQSRSHKAKSSASSALTHSE